MVSLSYFTLPICLSGKELTPSQQYAAIGAASFPLLWLSGAGSAVFWILGKVTISCSSQSLLIKVIIMHYMPYATVITCT